MFEWNVDPELVKLFGVISIRYYSLLFAAGLFLGYSIVKKMYEKEGLPQENLDKLALYVFIGTVLGARLGHCLFYEPAYFLSHPLEMLLPIQNGPDGWHFTGFHGLASHGGILGVFLAIYWYCCKTGDQLFATLDRVAIAGALAGTFIRLGNFMNSEIIGKATHSNYGVVFKQVDDLPRHPAQLYEAVAYFLIFLVIFYVYKNRDTQKKKGFIFGLFFVLLFVSRFLIEFFKENQVGFEDALTINMGQILSLPFIAAGLLVMIWKR